VKVYGSAGPKMTWEQRAKAGVPAEKFQADWLQRCGRRGKGPAAFLFCYTTIGARA